MEPEEKPAPVGPWLAPLRQLYLNERARFQAIPDEQKRWDLLCELNVVEQVRAACALSIVQEAWAGGRDLAIHGWIYNMRDGRLRDLNVTVSPRL